MAYPLLCCGTFKRILIYPDQYYSTITHRYHKGEVNPAAQAIVLSWNNFLAGYARPDDSLNLGLHEMAHALEIENLIDNDEYDFLPPAIWEQWQAQAAAYRTGMNPNRLWLLPRLRRNERQGVLRHCGRELLRATYGVQSVRARIIRHVGPVASAGPG